MMSLASSGISLWGPCCSTGLTLWSPPLLPAQASPSRVDALAAIEDIERFWLDTSSGRRVNLARPQPEDISCEDIAGALSRICRFGGHAREYFSVAQHALLVEAIVVGWGRTDLSLPALHHDSHEAFTCDIPSPLKKLLVAANEYRVYQAMRDRFDEAISQAFGFPLRLSASDTRLVKRADSVAFALEAARLLANGGTEAIADRDGYVQELAFRECPEPLPPSTAKDTFLTRHKQLLT